MIDPLLTGVAANFLTAVAKNTISGLGSLLSKDELKSVLNQAYTDFKENFTENRGKTDEKILLQVFEDFFSDGRTIREFKLIFENQSESVDFNLLEEIFFNICTEKGIDIPAFNFSYAMSHVIKEIESLAQRKEKLRETFKVIHLEKIYQHLQKRGMEPNFTFARQKYLHQLIIHNQRLQFTGIPDLKEKKDISISSVFVMPRAAEQVPAKDYEESIQEKAAIEGLEESDLQLQRSMKITTQEKKDPVKFDPVLIESGKKWFVVLGKPGSGKSTLLKYFMLTAAQNQLDDHRSGENLLFPIFVELRKLENALARTNKPDYNILDYLYDSIRQNYNLSLPGKFFEKYLDSGRALLMFDGLDEVAAEARRADIRQMITTFIASYNNKNTVIITSRIAGYNRLQFHDGDYRHFILSDFNEGEINEFIQKWYCSRLTNKTEAEAKAGELRKAIEKRPRLNELAKNPLLLTIIAIIHRYEAQLPEDRLILYDKASEALLYTWDNVKEIIDEKFKPEDKRRFLEKVAFHLQSMERGDEGGTMIDRQEVYKILFPDFCRIFQVDNRQCKGLVDEFLDRIGTRAGLLVEQAPDRYGFVHKTFQEYFAAKYIYNDSYLNFDLRIMLDYVDRFVEDAYWQETLLLAFRAFPNKQTKNILEHILKRDPQKIEKYLYHNHYFVMKFIAELGQWLDDKDFVINLIDGFFDFSWNKDKDRGYSSNKTWDRFRNWISSITCPFVLSILSGKLQSLAGDNNRDGKLRQYCAQALGDMGMKARAVELLLAIVEDKNQEDWLKHDCVEIIGKMGAADNAVVDRIFDIGRDNRQDVRFRCSCIEAVGNLGATDIAVIDRLFAIAEDKNQEGRLRRFSVEAVGRMELKDETVIDRLLTIAEDINRDGRLRRSYAEALGKLGVKNKAVEILLSIIEDTHQDVLLRRSCAEAVGNLEVKEKSVSDRLFALVEDNTQDGWLRGVCAIAVGNLGLEEKSLIDRLLEIVENIHYDGGLRRYCAESVGNLGVKDKIVIDRLIAIAGDISQDRWLRGTCASIVGILGVKDETVSDRLLAIAQNTRQDGWLRHYCAVALGDLGEKDKALELSLAIAQDNLQESRLRGGCAKAVGRLGEKNKAVKILIDLYRKQKNKYTDEARLIYDSLWDLTVI